jgi:phospholipid-binding lipoprotein MlaA
MAQDEFKGFDDFEDEFAQEPIKIFDPLRPINKLMFTINDKIYFIIIKPIAKQYKKITPRPARISVKNFFNNLATPGRCANCILQGKFHAANTEFKRFAVNSTIGILGLSDPARDKMGLIQTNEDLGQTLAKYGFKNGFYVVWPLLGPSTLRDSIGMAGDSFTNPIIYLESTRVYLATSVAKSANEYSFRLGDYESFKEGTVDPYTAMRDAYIQYRKQQVKE